MNKPEAYQALETKYQKSVIERGMSEWEEIIDQLKVKLDTMPNDYNFNSDSFNELRTDIEHYAPKRKRVANSTKTYFELIIPIANVTEKAIAVVTGTNNKSGSNYREYLEWIPTSQIVEENGKTFIPAWIVSKNNMWHVVNRNSKLTREA